MPSAFYFIKKTGLTQVFFCEFYKNFKSTVSKENLRSKAFEKLINIMGQDLQSILFTRVGTCLLHEKIFKLFSQSCLGFQRGLKI